MIVLEFLLCLFVLVVGVVVAGIVSWWAMGFARRPYVYGCGWSWMLFGMGASC